MKKNIKYYVFTLLLISIATILVGCGKKEEKDENEIDPKVKTALKKLCRNLNSKGNFSDETGKCSNFTCIYEYDGSKYELGCNDETEEVKKVNKSSLTLKANRMLKSACSNLNSKGNYETEDGTVKCEEFICSTELSTYEFSLDCKVANE